MIYELKANSACITDFIDKNEYFIYIYFLNNIIFLLMKLNR